MSVIHDTGPALPEHAICTRKIGPFSRDTIPKGLQRSHNLKQGSWSILEVLEGSIDFIWEDGTAPRNLSQGDRLVIPPQTDHHLEITQDVSITIAFFTNRNPAQ